MVGQSQGAGAPQIVPWTLVGLDTPALFEYFRGLSKQQDLTPAVSGLVNATVKHVLAACTEEHQLSAQEEARLVSCSRQLYFRVLQHLLQTLFPTSVVESGKRVHRAVSPHAHKVLQRKDLHLGLLHCTLLLVCTQEGMECNLGELLDTQNVMLSVWDATRWFLDCFTSPATGCSLAEPHVQNLRAIQEHAEEYLVLRHGSSFYEIMYQGGGTAHLEADLGLVADFLSAAGQKLLTRTYQCVTTLTHQHVITQGGAAHQQGHQGSLAAQLHHGCMYLADHLLMERLDLAFDQHLAVLVVCILYGVVRVLKVEGISFRAVTNTVLITWGPQLDAAVFKHVPIYTHSSERLGQPASSAQMGHVGSTVTQGDARAFFNNMFVTACEHMMRQVQAGGGQAGAAQARVLAGHGVGTSTAQAASAGMCATGDASQRNQLALPLQELGLAGTVGGRLSVALGVHVGGVKHSTSCQASDTAPHVPVHLASDRPQAGRRCSLPTTWLPSASDYRQANKAGGTQLMRQPLRPLTPSDVSNRMNTCSALRDERRRLGGHDQGSGGSHKIHLPAHASGGSLLGGLKRWRAGWAEEGQENEVGGQDAAKQPRFLGSGVIGISLM